MRTLLVALLCLGHGATARADFVSVAEAARLVVGGATVLDARGDKALAKGHLPGAQPIDWMDFRDRRRTFSALGRSGRLDDDLAKDAARLAALGVDDRRPVLVYGEAREGWGEEGRIAWMLEYLGHPSVRILDGGLPAWRAAGRPVIAGAAAAPVTGRFVAQPRGELRAVLPQVLAAAERGGFVILDVRSPEEYAGATPHFEPRGGHIPGAHHLEWRTLLDESGRVLPRDELLKRLAAAGITVGEHARPVITYCTGGVRSAFAFEVLRSLGVPTRNYDGSFFEWSLRPELPVAR